MNTYEKLLERNNRYTRGEKAQSKSFIFLGILFALMGLSIYGQVPILSVYAVTGVGVTMVLLSTAYLIWTPKLDRHYVIWSGVFYVFLFSIAIFAIGLGTSDNCIRPTGVAAYKSEAFLAYFLIIAAIAGKGSRTATKMATASVIFFYAMITMYYAASVEFGSIQQGMITAQVSWLEQILKLLFIWYFGKHLMIHNIENLRFGDKQDG